MVLLLYVSNQAPELLIGDDGYTNVVDWWTLGILLYEMLTGIPPFYSEDLNEMYRRIVEEDLTFPSHVSPLARDLLSKVFCFPALRFITSFAPSLRS